MIKFYAQAKNGAKIIGVGLTKENVKRLEGDEPIHFQLDQFGIEGTEVIIFYGATEETIKQELKDRKLIPQDTP